MAMICSLSNEVPEEPVISLTSKHIFEKRLLEKYIAENGTDPINGEPLSDEQIVAVNTTPVQRPRPPTATSIPAILKILQVRGLFWITALNPNYICFISN